VRKVSEENNADEKMSSSWRDGIFSRSAISGPILFPSLGVNACDPCVSKHGQYSAYLQVITFNPSVLGK